MPWGRRHALAQDSDVWEDYGMPSCVRECQECAERTPHNVDLLEGGASISCKVCGTLHKFIPKIKTQRKRQTI